MRRAALWHDATTAGPITRHRVRGVRASSSSCLARNLSASAWLAAKSCLQRANPGKRGRAPCIPHTTTASGRLSALERLSRAWRLGFCFRISISASERPTVSLFSALPWGIKNRTRLACCDHPVAILNSCLPCEAQARTDYGGLYYVCCAAAVLS